MFKNKVKKAPRGFTLIEILVVIGIIAILATIVIVAINPARQFAQANNTTRTSNVNTILNAIGQYMADNKGAFSSCLANITTSSLEIKSGVSGGADLGCLAPTYVTALPFDPNGIATASSTGYFVTKDANGRVTVSAPSTQLCSATPCPSAEQISVTR